MTYYIWYEFHGNPGHKTTDCRHLREEVANMLARAHLQEYLSERAKNNYGRARADEEKDEDLDNTVKKNSRLPEENLVTFSDQDATVIALPYNDVLVIIVLIGNYRVKRVIVDLESSANILCRKVIEEMGFLGEIIPAARTLAGFKMSSETTKGEVGLPAEAGGVTKKKRPIAEVRNRFVKEEVSRLLNIGSIREVKYADWLANVVVVLKKPINLKCA
ncbi:uncharacterized protein LOC132031944 [Lycium ferocissimum]|uniref:uncharacterized protein LOC132031944 n=1 Tax=Lycium ferocissimum TaxID=112874 RepID=UPI0028156FCF|nr:uncharacterized protein LOC132031944 [Lycium ferocissimum]